jgi:hypothetical protein
MTLAEFIDSGTLNDRTGFDDLAVTVMESRKAGMFIVAVKKKDGACILM